MLKHRCIHSYVHFLCELEQNFFYFRCGDKYVGEYCEDVNPCSLFIINPCKNGGSCDVYMDQRMGAQATCKCSIGRVGGVCVYQAPCSLSADQLQVMARFGL